MFTPAIGLSTHIWNNNARALLLLAGFPVLLAFMAFGVSVIFAAGSDSLFAAFAHAWRNLPWFFGFGLILAGAWFAIALATHQRIMDWITGARPVTRESDKRLWDLMETLCISRGETMPRLGLIETEARNAFASGLSRKHGVITVTRGLVDALDDRELSAVLAHELVHIRNGDARLAVIAAIFSGIMTLGFGGGSSSGSTPAPAPPREEAPPPPPPPPPEEPPRRGGWWRWLFRGRRGGSSNNSGLAIVIIIIGIIIIIVAATLSVALRLALSRNREYLADAGAVAITGDADAMISALRRIEAQSTMQSLPGQVQAMLLHSASGASGPSLWSTHPPIADRIAALIRFAGGRDPGPIAEVTAPEVTAAPEAPRADAPSAGPWAQNASPLSEELARLRARRDNGA